MHAKIRMGNPNALSRLDLRIRRSASVRKLKSFRSFHRAGVASMQLVMATAIAIPIAGGLLFLGFKICRFVFAALAGSLTMPFV